VKHEMMRLLEIAFTSRKDAKDTLKNLAILAARREMPYFR
jgi:hypothetical protein